MSIGDTFKTGQTCAVSGVYRNMTCETRHAAGDYEIPLSKGETFPPCRHCKSAVSWKLVRYA